MMTTENLVLYLHFENLCGLWNILVNGISFKISFVDAPEHPHSWVLDNDCLESFNDFMIFLNQKNGITILNILVSRLNDNPIHNAKEKLESNWTNWSQQNFRHYRTSKIDTLTFLTLYNFVFQNKIYFRNKDIKFVVLY